MDLRLLSPPGVMRFRSYIRGLTAGTAQAPPVYLLADPAFTEQATARVRIDDAGWEGRLELARWLDRRLNPLTPAELEHEGLWSWLSLRLFDRLCPQAPDGTRVPGRDYRFIPSPDYRHRYRHLVRAPFELFRRHGERARVFLGADLARHGDVMEQVASRIEFVENPGIVEALDLLYFDNAAGALKRGATNRARPGTLRRFVSVIQQLDLTYDLFSMSGPAILALLPPEFDEWRPDPGGSIA